MHGGDGGGLPDVIPDQSIPADKLDDGKIGIVSLVRLCGFASSNGEARRLVAERGVRVNGDVVEDIASVLSIGNGDVVQRGKRRFVRLVIG